MVWLSTEADDQSSLHCVIVSTDVMSDHSGRRHASREALKQFFSELIAYSFTSRGRGCSDISIHIRYDTAGVSRSSDAACCQITLDTYYYYYYYYTRLMALFPGLPR